MKNKSKSSFTDKVSAKVGKYCNFCSTKLDALIFLDCIFRTKQREPESFVSFFLFIAVFYADIFD